MNIYDSRSVLLFVQFLYVRVFDTSRIALV